MGRFLNEYEELKLLGKGSFAKIYKVRHLELDYIRAIRVLNETVSDNDNDNKVYQSFIRECKTLLRLGNGGHPHIVRIYQPNRLQNHALVEMDYIDGCDLDDYLREKQGFVPIGEVMRFVREIGSALAYCHVDCYEYMYDKSKEYEYKLESKWKGQKFRIGSDPNNGKKDLITPQQHLELIREYGITHNDLHSKNIMRKRYDGSYILLDFGLAIQDGKAVKSSSRRDGAVEYKAPEKSNRGGIISEQSDVYSFGILIYEMLAGRVPFLFQKDKYSKEEEALFQLSLAHEQAPPPEIEPFRRAAFETANPGKEYQKDYPEWLEQVIMKCLEKKPGDRYANGKELFLEVERLAALEAEKHSLPVPPANDELLNLKNELQNSKNDFDNLAKQLGSATFIADKLQKENSGFKDEIRHLKEERDDFKAQSDSLSERVGAISEKTEKAEQLATDLQNRLEEKEKDNSTLSADLKNTREERDDFEAKNGRLSQHVADLSLKNNESEKLTNDLRTRLREEENGTIMLSGELEDLRKERDDFKAQTNNLSQQATNLSQEVANLSQEVANLSLKNEEAEKFTNELHSKLRESAEQADILSGEIEEKSKLANDLQTKLNEKEENNLALSVELEDLKKERDDFNSKNEDLSKQMIILSGKNENLSAQINILSEKNKEADKLTNDLQTKLIAEENSNRSLFLELTDLTTERDDFRNKTTNLTEQITAWEKKHEEAGKLAAGLQSKLRESAEQIDILSGEIEEKSKLANDLQTRLNKKEENNLALSVELEDLRKERDDFNSKNEALSKQMIILSGKNENLSAQMNILSEKNEEADKLAYDLQTRLETEENSNRSLFVELTDLTTERDHFKAQISNLSGQVADLSLKNNESEKFTNDLQSKLLEEEKRNRTISVALEDLRKERDDFRNQTANMTEQITAWKGKHEEAGKLAAGLQITLKKEEEKNTALYGDLNAVKNERDGFKDGNEKLSKQIKTLESKNENLSKKVESLEKEIKKKPNIKRWKRLAGIAAAVAVAALAVTASVWVNKPSGDIDTSSFETTISQQKAEIESLQGEKSQLQTNLDNTQKTLSDLQKNDKTGALTSAYKQIDELKKEKNDLQTRLSQAKAADNSAAIAQKDRKITTLQDQLTESERQKNMINAAYQKYRKEHP